MGVLSRLYAVKTDFNFAKAWKIMIPMSLLLVIGSIVALSVNGLNLAIDFRGGAVWEVPSKTMTTSEAEEVLAEFDKSNGSKVQSVTDSNGVRIVRVQAEKAKNITEAQEIAAKLAEAADVDIEDVATNTVGPSWGKSITQDAIRALIVFFIVIAAYMSWTLEWRMAVSALVAVVHDVIITVGFYAVLGFEVTPATVISVLTILGFSLYDTIVVYDRVREIADRYDRTGNYTYSAMMRRALNQVLMRSINTTLVATLPVLAILVVGGILYGQATLEDFSLALLVGLIAGAYSSIGVASPLTVWLKEREPKYVKIRQRAKDRGTEDAANWIRLDAPLASATSAAAAAGASAAAGPRPSPLAAKAAQYQRDHPPRPRKQGKKR